MFFFLGLIFTSDIKNPVNLSWEIFKSIRFDWFCLTYYYYSGNRWVFLTFSKCYLESVFFYIPGCSEEPDHSNQQITQMNWNLKEDAKQQPKKWNVYTMNKRKGMSHKRWVESDLSMKGKNGYLFGKLCFERFRKESPSPGCYRTDLKTSFTRNVGQKNCLVSVSHYHETTHQTFKTECYKTTPIFDYEGCLWFLLEFVWIFLFRFFFKLCSQICNLLLSYNLPSFEKNPLLLLTIWTTPIILQ